MTLRIPTSHTVDAGTRSLFCDACDNSRAVTVHVVGAVKAAMASEREAEGPVAAACTACERDVYVCVYVCCASTAFTQRTFTSPWPLALK